MSTHTYPHVRPKPLSFIPAARLQQSFVTAAEKRTLLWLAERTPHCINSDHLTLLGFVALCLAGVCYALARWNRYTLFLGVVFLALNWLGDPTGLAGSFVHSSPAYRVNRLCSR